MIDTNNITIALTDARIRKAIVPDSKAEIYLKDLKQHGLTVRVRKSGARSFYFTHTRPGMKGSHKTFIGKFPALGVAAARKQAAMLAGERARGIDLTEDRRKQKQDAIKARKEAAAVVTLGHLIAEPADGEEDNCPYAMARRDRERIANWKQELSYLRRNLWDHRNVNIRELTRRDITVAMDKLDAAGKRGASAGLWKHTRAFLSWCVETGHIDVHPLANVRRRRKGSRADRLEREARGRALTDAEICKVWAAAGGMGSPFGLLVKFCLASGCRRAEAASLKWSDVLNDRVMIAAENTKQGRRHAIAKTTLLNEVLEEAAQHFRRASSPLVFPGRGERPFSGFTKALNRLIEQAGTDRFSMHDLRRSCRSCLSRLGFSSELARLCIGQQPEALDKIYNKDPRWGDRCEAFRKYHAHITSLIGGNVINLQDHAQALAAG